MPTSATENKEIARKYPEEAINEGNLDVIDEIFATDLIWRGNTLPEPLEGPEDVKEFVSMIRTAFPDIEATVENVVAGDDKVVLLDRITGTHEGEFMGVGATGKEVEIEGIEIMWIENGQIVEARAQAEMMDLLQQLGFFVIPGPSLMTRMVIGKVKSILE